MKAQGIVWLQNSVRKRQRSTERPVFRSQVSKDLGIGGHRCCFYNKWLWQTLKGGNGSKKSNFLFNTIQILTSHSTCHTFSTGYMMTHGLEKQRRYSLEKRSFCASKNPLASCKRAEIRCMTQRPKSSNESGSSSPICMSTSNCIVC